MMHKTALSMVATLLAACSSSGSSNPVGGRDGKGGGADSGGAVGSGGVASGGSGGAASGGGSGSGGNIADAGTGGSAKGGNVAGAGGKATGGSTGEGAGGKATSSGGAGGAMTGAGGATGTGGKTTSAGGMGGGTTVASGGAGGGSTPCTGAAVKVTQSGSKYTLDNGFIQATINASSAEVPSFVVNGVETMASGGGYFSWGTNVYTAGPFTGSLSADPAKNGGEVAEVAMTTTWDGSSGKIPLDLEVRFALPRCSHGLYEYVVLTHTASYPAFTPGELRINHYVNWDSVLDWYAVDDNRRGVFTAKAAAQAATAVSGAPKEVLKYTSGPFADRPGWQKYDNSLPWGEGTVYGWSSSSKNVGLWLINPSNEYLPGGPMKLELTLHDAGSKAALLNYWGGSHFYGAFEDVKANQVLEKVLGPWVLYGNATKTTGSAGQDALWADAKNQLAVEKAAWPYAWESDPRYPQRAGRGTVKGQLSYSDPAATKASVANAWVGLAGPPVGGVANFEHQGWGYQYWVHADGQGSFSIPNVRPGKYTLHAFVAGIHGVYLGKTDDVVVTAAAATDLGTVTWAPDRQGPTAWEIGVPDRTPAEFFLGDRPWYYGMNKRFASDFPNGVNFTVGTSDWSKQWSYVQPGGTWNVTFDVAEIPAGATGASLVLDVAGSDGVTLTATVNGSKTGSVALPFDDGSIDRDQPHGAFQSGRIAVPRSQIKTGTNTLAIASSSNLMWDYLRLEWVTK